MKKFLKDHMEAMLVFYAAIFIVVILWFLFATIQTVVSQVNRAVVTPTAPPQQGFDLKGAGHIDFRGLTVSSSATSAVSAVTPPVSFAAGSSTQSSSPTGAASSSAGIPPLSSTPVSGPSSTKK